MKYRKKPVVIDARRWPDDQDDNAAGQRKVVTWIDLNGGECRAFLGDGRLRIQTLEGQMIAEIGDWIIKGVKGEFYPCKPAIFEMTYEAAD